MSNTAFLRKELVDDLSALEREATEVYERVVIPNRDAGKPSLGRTIHAYMMALMARVDLASLFWKGPGGGQTLRMTAFMGHYICPDAEVNRVLVKMWRHTLMHTGRPRQLLRSRGGEPYYWLLHWKESLPAEIHLTFLDEPGMRKLNIGMLYFLADMKRGFDRYLDDVSADPHLQANALAAQVHIDKEAAI